MRLIIVSNRLPFIATQVGESFKFKNSNGGLATSLNSYIKSYQKDGDEYVWVGWPGLSVKEKGKRETLSEYIHAKYNCYPVFLSEKTIKNFYNGFCNQIIWPLFHGFIEYISNQKSYWEAYKLANRKYFQAVAKIIKPDDIVWIHDYHLMLLPLMLRRKYPNLKIGFFIHIPFPEHKLLKFIPKEYYYGFLKGVLGANLIGFHIDEYKNNFINSVIQTLNLKTNIKQIYGKTNNSFVNPFPISIDYDQFESIAKRADIIQKQAEFKKIYRGKKIISSVDRLDYTKGIVARLEAFSLFLSKYPKYHQKVVYYLILAPSRVDINQYQNTKEKVEELVNTINKKYGNLNWQPVVYKYENHGIDDLVVLYGSTDLALITPIKDGMNLVAKEYLASWKDKKGVLILSRNAGAAEELNKALIVNPIDRESVSEAIMKALEMPEKEQIKRNEVMQKIVKSKNVSFWANNFLNFLSGLERSSNQSIINPKSGLTKSVIKLLPKI